MKNVPEHTRTLDRPYLGSGWSFPPRLDPTTGRIVLAHEVDDVEEAIRIILLTRPGERQMRPEFGSELHRLTFAPLEPTTFALAVRYVRNALLRWEPRIEQVEVFAADSSAGDTAEGILLLDIRYKLFNHTSARSLVFPFYVIPGDE